MLVILNVNYYYYIMIQYGLSPKGITECSFYVFSVHLFLSVVKHYLMLPCYFLSTPFIYKVKKKIGECLCLAQFFRINELINQKHVKDLFFTFTHTDNVCALDF